MRKTNGIFVVQWSFFPIADQKSNATIEQILNSKS